MDYSTKIQWTDFTINFWEGCFKVDEECKFCYMYRDMEKYGKDPRAIREISITTINKKIKAARELLAKRKAEGDNTPVRLFLSSWTDAFLKEADQFRERFWKVIRENPDLIFQVLTKRPELIPDRLPADWGEGWAHVWLGTSVGQPKSMHRITELLKVPARVHFLSCEPLLEPLILRNYLDKIDWVIVGGESGNNKGKYLFRPCYTHWIHGLIVQCKAANVPVFVKQLGTHLAKQLKLSDRHGGNIDEWPEHLRVREMLVTDG